MYYDREEQRNQSNFFQIKDSLENMLKSFNLEQKYLQTLAITKWDLVMGASVATRTEKIFFENDSTLVVVLNSAPLRHQLNQSKSKLIKILNQEIGKEIISDIKIL